MKTEATEGSATLTDTEAGKDVNVKAGKDATLENTTAGNNVTAETTNGDVKLTDTTAGSSVTATGGNNATLANTDAKNDVTATAGKDATLSNTVAGNDVTATVGKDATLTDTTAGNDVTTTAGNNATLTGTTAGRNIMVNAANGNASMNTTNAKSLKVIAGSNVTLTDTNAEENITARAGNDATLKTTKAGNNVTVEATSGDTELTDTIAKRVITEAGNDVTLDKTTAKDNVEATAGGHATLEDTTTDILEVTAGNDLTIGETDTQSTTAKAGGRIMQVSGAVLQANLLDMQADGDIGSSEEPIDVFTDEITAIGENVYLINHSESLLVHNIKGSIVDILTMGDINTTREGLVEATWLTLHAVGSIGTPDAKMRLNVTGSMKITSDAGTPWYVNLFWPTLKDRTTQLQMRGHFDIAARLFVLTTAEFARTLFPEATDKILKDLDGEEEEYFNFTGGCPKDVLQVLIDNLTDETGANELLWRLIGDGRTLFDFVTYITQPRCDSRITVKILLSGLDPEYKDELEGEDVYVMASVDGELICAKGTVTDGKVEVDIESLGISKELPQYTQFVIISEEVYEELVEEELIQKVEPETEPMRALNN